MDLFPLKPKNCRLNDKKKTKHNRNPRWQNVFLNKVSHKVFQRFKNNSKVKGWWIDFFFTLHKKKQKKCGREGNFITLQTLELVSVLGLFSVSEWTNTEYTVHSTFRIFSYFAFAGWSLLNLYCLYDNNAF